LTTSFNGVVFNSIISPQGEQLPHSTHFTRTVAESDLWAWRVYHDIRASVLAFNHLYPPHEMEMKNIGLKCCMLLSFVSLIDISR